MQVVFPTKVMPFSCYGARHCFPDGKLAVVSMSEEADYVDVKDILVEPQRNIGVSDVIRGKTSRRLGRRNNPVIHIAAASDFYYPSVEGTTARTFNASQWCAEHRDMSVFTDTLPATTSCVVVYDQRLTGTIVESTIIYLYRYSVTRSFGLQSIQVVRQDLLESRYEVRDSWVPYSPRYETAFVYGNTDEPYGSVIARARSAISNMPSGFVHMGYRGWYGTGSYSSQDFIVSEATKEDVILSVEKAMRASLRFNEETLFSASSYDRSLSYLQPPDLQMALGAAFDSSLEARTDASGQLTNAGLPTLGFNNLQNLGSAVSGLMALGFGKTEGTLDALEGLRLLRSNREDLYERMLSIGKRSIAKMVNDRDWINLTPSQQRRILRSLKLDALVGTSNADLATLNDLLTSTPEGDVVADTWFRGRYVWSTGWSDAEQAYRYFWYHMQQALGQEPEHPTLHGKSTFTTDDGVEVTARVSYACQERVVRGFAGLAKRMWETGMAPTAAVLYDFIPFSFIVDWFFPMQGALEQFDRTTYQCPLYYQYLWPRFCCSVKYRAKTYLGFEVRCYTRWYQGDAPSPDLGHTLLTGGKTPSSKTTAFRFADGLLLLLRR